MTAPFLAAYEPSTQEIGHLFQLFFWFLGCVAVVLGILLTVKKLREEPAPAPPPMQSPLLVKGVEELATVRGVEERFARWDADTRERIGTNAKKIVALEQRLEDRHKENVGRLDEIEGKLDRNYQLFVQVLERRDEGAEKRTNDLRALITDEMRAVHERVNEVVGGFGELRGEMKHVAAHARECSLASTASAEAARGAIQAANEVGKTRVRA